MERMGALLLLALAGLLMVAYRVGFWAARGWAVDVAPTADARRWRAALARAQRDGG